MRLSLGGTRIPFPFVPPPFPHVVAVSWALGPTFSIFQLGIFPIDLRPRRRANINAAINLQRRYAAGVAPRSREGDPFLEGGVRGRRKNRAFTCRRHTLRVAKTLVNINHRAYPKSIRRGCESERALVTPPVYECFFRFPDPRCENRVGGLHVDLRRETQKRRERLASK